MDRQIVYPGAIPLDTDILNTQRNVMIAEGFLAQAMLGTGPVFNGLACTAQTVPNMTVSVGPGIVVAAETVDATAFGSLALDTADALVKVGVNLTSNTFTLTAPSTSGDSINYLIEGAFSETDTTSVVLPYYNASNPTVAYSGPANSGAPQNTQRIQRVALQLKAGSQATTGSQTTPAVDAGYTALYVITVAYGATTVVNGNISTVAGAPFIGGGSLLPGRLINVQKWSAHGTYTYVPTVGTNSVMIEGTGAGGSGGGAATTSAGNEAAGSGGASGSFLSHRATSGFAGATIVIGQGGVAPTAGANNGNAGGTTSVTATGFTLTAPGGSGGLGCASQAASFITGPGIPGSVASGGSLLNTQGDPGGHSLGITAGGNYYVVSGQGGASNYGEGGAPVGSTSAGVAGGAPGAGGSGGSTGGGGSGGSAVTGGAGADGYVIILEYS